MNRTFRCAVTVAALVLCSSTAALAQATRTWVSGVGDDVNPCSRTAPCKTFAGAISKTAAGGVISVLDPGGFGAVTITKAITIDGGGIDGSILASGTNGVVINAALTDHVTLRNITIFGGGTGVTGVRIVGAGSVTIEHVVINGFTNGIYLNASTQLAVHDSFINRTTGFGIQLRQGRTTIENVRLDGTGLDAVRVSDTANAVIRGSSASGNTNVALSALGAAAKLIVEDCLVANNAYGIGAMEGGTIRVSNSTIVSNTSMGLYFDATSSLQSFGNNRVSGNTADGSFSVAAATLR